MNIVFFTISVLFILLVVTVTSGRRPYTSFKKSFAVFGAIFIFWDLSILLRDYYAIPEFVSGVLGILVFAILLLFALNFPFFMRTKTGIIAWVAGLLGGALTVIVSGFYYYRTEGFYDPLPVLVCELVLAANFGAVFYRKIRIAVPRFSTFYFNTLLLLTGTGFIIYFSDIDYLAVEPAVKYANILFLLSVVSFKIHFPPFDHSPSVLSVFNQGRTPRLVFENVVPAADGVKKVRDLKQELWKLYEKSSMPRYIDKFWFNILVDETLDNAVEHGGKRQDDDITIQIYEGKKYIDFYITDRGKGFNPKDVPSPLEEHRKDVPSGRGIHLMKSIFHIRWNFLGNEVRVRVNRKSGLPYSPSNSQIE